MNWAIAFVMLSSCLWKLSLWPISSFLSFFYDCSPFHHLSSSVCSKFDRKVLFPERKMLKCRIAVLLMGLKAKEKVHCLFINSSLESAIHSHQQCPPLSICPSIRASISRPDLRSSIDWSPDQTWSNLYHSVSLHFFAPSSSKSCFILFMICQWLPFSASVACSSCYTRFPLTFPIKIQTIGSK